MSNRTWTPFWEVWNCFFQWVCWSGIPNHLTGNTDGVYLRCASCFDCCLLGKDTPQRFTTHSKSDTLVLPKEYRVTLKWPSQFEHRASDISFAQEIWKQNQNTFPSRIHAEINPYQLQDLYFSGFPRTTLLFRDCRRSTQSYLYPHLDIGIIRRGNIRTITSKTPIVTNYHALLPRTLSAMSSPRFFRHVGHIISFFYFFIINAWYSLMDSYFLFSR